MYIDKKLKALKQCRPYLVPTALIRKMIPLILDFVNNAEDIKDAYAPYFEVTELAEAVDINMIYDIRKQIHDLRLYTQADIERFLSIYYKVWGDQDRHGQNDQPVQTDIGALPGINGRRAVSIQGWLAQV